MFDKTKHTETDDQKPDPIDVVVMAPTCQHDDLTIWGESAVGNPIYSCIHCDQHYELASRLIEMEISNPEEE